MFDQSKKSKLYIKTKLKNGDKIILENVNTL